MKNWALALGVTALFAAGCGDDEAEASCTDCCADGFPRGSAAQETRLVSALTPSPEGVAVCPDGSVYVALAASAEIQRVPPGGAAPERWAGLGDMRPAGLACDARGRLLVAVFSSGSAGATLALVEGRDAQPVPLPKPTEGKPLGGVNGVVAIEGLGVYGSDTLSDQIFLLRDAGGGALEAAGVTAVAGGPNGLAYDPGAKRLYAALTVAGQLVAFDVAEDGTLGPAETIWTAAPAAFPDGVAVDEQGTPYVATYGGGAVVRVSDNREVARVEHPASLAFRGGTLMITDYRLGDPTAPGGLYALDLGVCGAPARQ